MSSALAEARRAHRIEEERKSLALNAHESEKTTVTEAHYEIAKAKEEVALCRVKVELIRTPEGKEERLQAARAKVEEITRRPETDHGRQRLLQNAQAKLEEIEDEAAEERKLEKAEARLREAKTELKEAEAKLKEATEAKLKEAEEGERASPDCSLLALARA